MYLWTDEQIEITKKVNKFWKWFQQHHCPNSSRINTSCWKPWQLLNEIIERSLLDDLRKDRGSLEVSWRQVLDSWRSAIARLISVLWLITSVWHTTLISSLQIYTLWYKLRRACVSESLNLSIEPVIAKSIRICHSTWSQLLAAYSNTATCLGRVLSIGSLGPSLLLVVVLPIRLLYYW